MGSVELNRKPPEVEAWVIPEVEGTSSGGATPEGGRKLGVMTPEAAPNTGLGEPEVSSIDTCGSSWVGASAGSWSARSSAGSGLSLASAGSCLALAA